MRSCTCTCTCICIYTRTYACTCIAPAPAPAPADALEENHAAAAEPAALVAAYAQLSALYAREQDHLGAHMARENAKAIEMAAVAGAAKGAR